MGSSSLLNLTQHKIVNLNLGHNEAGETFDGDAK